MASPPNHTPSPSAMSPPNPASAQLPKKRPSTLDVNAPPVKRRKASMLSQASAGSHPLRQTSFPPELHSPAARSPSVDGSSHVSGSAVSAPGKKKRGRKSKKTKREEAAAAAAAAAAKEGTPSLVSGRAGTTASGQNNDAQGEEDDEDENQETALEDLVLRTQEQKQEEIRLRAMLVEAFDDEQLSRYELFRAVRLPDSVIKRVTNATVSQSVPQQVSTAVRAVTKLFAGEIIEAARQVQAEMIAAGENQSELPTPPYTSAAPLSLTGGHEEKEEEKPEPRRGPLRPEHLREAWRRYRFSGESRGVGVQQLWHSQQCDGVERFSTRTGKRLFK